MLSSSEGSKGSGSRTGEERGDRTDSGKGSTWISDAVMSGGGRGGTRPHDGVHLPTVKERLGAGSGEK